MCAGKEKSKEGRQKGRKGLEGGVMVIVKIASVSAVVVVLVL
jgi:hypothetical protein